MFVGKYIVMAVLALPVAEFVVFVVIASQIGFLWTLLALIAVSLTGALVLRFGGGSQIERARSTLGSLSYSTLHTEGSGFLILVAGFLLLLPGFITGLAGALLLIPPLRRLLSDALQRSAERAMPREPGVVDLEPDDWRRVPQSRIDKNNGADR